MEGPLRGNLAGAAAWKFGGEKALDNPTSCTFKFAEAGSTFVSPCWVFSALPGIVLVYTPDTVEVTLTRIVHVEPAGIVALVNMTVEPPLLALTVAELPQFDNDDETGFARTTSAGRESVSDDCVNALSRSLLRIRMVSWLVCPTRIVFGEKLLLNVGD